MEVEVRKKKRKARRKGILSKRKKSKSSIQLQNKDNPLLNDIVLTELSKYLSISDLRNCRMVCKTWNAIAYNTISESCMIRFDYSERYSNCEEDKVLSYVNLFKQSCKKNGFPSNYSFTNVDMESESMDTFFAFCGPFIKYLHLKLDQSNINSNVFQDMLLEKIPILETLEIDELPYEVIKGLQLNSPYPICLTNLIINDPKIYGYRFFFEIFKMCQCLEQVKVPQQESNNVLLSLRDTKMLSTMKNIKFKRPSDGDFDTLVKLSLAEFELNTINFLSLADYFSSRTLETLLKLQKDSLEFMNIGGATYHLRIDCPTMKNIHTLKLNSYNRVLAPLICQTQFPNLKYLELCCTALESGWESFFHKSGNKVSFTGLKTLSLTGMVTNAETIKGLGKMFPAIKKLHMKVYKPSNDVIMHIWRYWIHLEEMVMHLHGTNKNIDCVFTGISVSDCATNKVLTRYNHFTKVLEIRRKPSIIDLKHLKRLFLYVSKPEDPTCLITDISGYYAFGMLPKLCELVLTWSQMSLPCLNHLKEKVSQCKISNSKLRHYRLVEDIGKPYFEIYK